MSTTEHEGGGNPPEPGVSREEFTSLTSAVGELREALEELRQASTPAERREAQGDVRDAKADLKAVAKELGLDPKRLEKAASEAKAQEFREQVRPILVELLDEELAIEPEGDGGGGGEKPPEEPKPDTPPRQGHWSERPLSELFGG